MKYVDKEQQECFFVNDVNKPHDKKEESDPIEHPCNIDLNKKML
jgi:hypothetical protein